MTNGIGSLSSGHSGHIGRMFSKLDTNNDGKVSRDEFVSGRPTDVTSDQAGQLFDKLDSKKTGALSKSDMSSAFQQMGSQMQAVMIQAQAAASNTNGSGDSQSPPDPSTMFSQLDANGDGSVSRDEFVNGRPNGVSKDQAGSLFDKIAKDSGASSGDGLTKDQLLSGLKANGPDQSASSSSSSDVQQLMSQLMSALQQLGQSQGQTEGHHHHGPPDAASMFKAADANGDGKVTRDEFVSSRPKEVSADQAGSFYDQIASAGGTSSSDGLTKDQFTTGLKAVGSGSASSATSSASDPGQLLDQLLASLKQTGSSTSTAGTSTNSQLMDELMKAIRSYQSASVQTVAATSAVAA